MSINGINLTRMNLKLFITASVICCGSLSSQSIAQTWELAPGGKDTINYTDVAGKKQRHWILFGKHKPGTCFAPTQKAEEGDYKENRKTGMWMEYYCNGTVKNKVTFMNGRPDGYAVIYYENGKVQEEGQWKNNRWVGNLKQYYENGTVQHDFKYNESGKKEGMQTYNHENGNVAVQGSFVDGKENGVVKEYTADGKLRSERTYNSGQVAAVKVYDVGDEKKVEKIKDEPKLVVKADEKPMGAEKAGPMILNGKHTLYDKNHHVTKDGLFENNTFMEGKAYMYNDNGILTRVMIYKGGKYVGDGVIEN
jgi:antitoxin component YwqK of YwqJK toxin-antitoxin module